MNDEVFNLCLLDMRDAIINKGFPFEDCLVVAMAHDHLADSSQDVLNSIKMPLGMSGFPIGNFCNRFDHCWGKRLKYKYHHYFIIDDFVGSGSTVFNRKNEFENRMEDNEYTLHFVVAAGMEYAIENLRNQGIDIHCSYTMKRVFLKTMIMDWLSTNFKSCRIWSRNWQQPSMKPNCLSIILAMVWLNLFSVENIETYQTMFFLCFGGNNMQTILSELHCLREYKKGINDGYKA